MAKRFTAEFKDTEGQQFRLNIFDDDYSGADVEATLTVARPGFELTYESEPDAPYQGIISSSLTAFLVNEGGSFDTWLSNIPNVAENDVTTTLERWDGSTYQLEWAGVVMIDQLEQVDIPTPAPVQIVANDGLAFLKTIRGSITEENANAQDVLEGANVINWMQEILTNVKTSVHWQAGDKFLRAWTDFKPDGWGTLNQTSGLNILEYASLYGANDPNTINVLDGTPEAYTDWTFLQSICMVFNARLCLANGEWHFWPVNQHILKSEGVDYTYLHRIYSKAGVLQSETQAEKGEFYTRTTPQLGPGTTSNRYTQLTGGTISHTIPRKNFRRSRPYAGQNWMNLSVRTGSASAINVANNGQGLVDFAAPQSFFTGAKFRVEGNIQVSRAGDTGYSGPANNAQLRLKFNMDVGSYRLDPANDTWTTDQTTDRFLFVGNLGSISSGFDTVLPLDYVTPPLPGDSEVLELDIDADFINGVGSSLNAEFATASPPTLLGCTLRTFLTNDAFQNLLVFQGETSLDNIEPYDQGQLVFGTVQDLGWNSGQLYVQNVVVGQTITWDMGTWVSSQSSSGEHINRLCVRECIALMQRALEKRAGQLKVGSGMRIPSPLMTIQDQAGTGYYMVTSVTYTAEDRLADVTRLRVNALTFTNVTDNGETGDPGDNTGNDGSGSGGSGTDGSGATNDDGSTGATSTGGGGGHTNTFADIQEVFQYDKDGLMLVNVKTGEKPLTADEVDDTSTTNKFATQGEKDDIANLKNTVKTTTGSGGKGVFVQTDKSTSASHVAVDSTTATVQAGSSTSVDVTETTSGNISLKVQAGSSGNETTIEAIEIEGDTSQQKAMVNIHEPVTFHAAINGISASDLSDVTSAGSGAIITTAERNKLNAIEAGAEVNDWSESGGNVYRSSGNVGIGTSTPAQALDVQGNVTADEYYVDSTKILWGDSTVQLGNYSGTDNIYLNTSGGTALTIGNTKNTRAKGDLTVDGDLITQSTSEVRYGNITTTQSGTVVNGGFMNPASEDNMVHLPHIVNDLAGFQKWGTITVSGLYKTRSGSAGSYTYSNPVTASDFDSGAAFDGYSSTAGSWYSDNGADGTTAGVGVVTLEWTNELTYTAFAGIVFGSTSFTAKRVKIEAYRGGAWQELCDLTDNSDHVVLRQIGSNSGTGSATTKLRYTLGGSVNNTYFRIHTLYAANYRAGDNNLSGTFTDKTRGVHYLEKYKNNYAHGHFYPAATNTYKLGDSSLTWSTIYANGGDSSQWNSAYGWGNHASAGYLTTSAGDGRYIRNDTSDSFSGQLTFNGTAGSDALVLGDSDINAVRQIHANEYHQNGPGIPRSNLGDPTVTEMALFEEQFTCKTGLNNDYDDLTDLTFWYQTNDGDTWTEQTETDDQKRKFLRTNNSAVEIANGTYKFRVEFHAKSYTFANALYFYWSTQGHNSQVHVWKKRCSDGVWIQHTNSTGTAANWPGHLWMQFNSIPWHETNTTSDGHFTDVRIEFTPNWNSTYPSNDIKLYGGQIWGGYPTGRRTPHRYDQNGRLITWGELQATGSFYAPVVAVSDGSGGGAVYTNNLYITADSGTVTNRIDNNGSHLYVSHGGPTDKAVVIDNTSGNVGIGTTTPSDKLEVADGYIRVSGTGTSHGFKLERPSLDTYRLQLLDGGFTIYNETDSRKELLVQNGNVGIGTTAPSGKLHVVGDAVMDGGPFHLTVDHGSNSGGHGLSLNGTGSNLPFVRWYDGTTILAGMRASSNGNFTIQTNGFNDRLTIDSSGNVGIGTTTPSEKLDVNGDAQVQGTLTITDGTDPFTFPAADGNANQVLQTDGAGNVTWATRLDGWHGDTTRQKIMATQFVMNDDYNRAPIMVEDDTTNKLGIIMPADTSEAYAMVAIPKGFKATHVQVYASASTTSAVEAFSYDHTNGDIASKGTGDFNASIDITDVSSANAVNLCVKIIPASTSTVIYGADVTIAKI